MDDSSEITTSSTRQVVRNPPWRSLDWLLLRGGLSLLAPFLALLSTPSLGQTQQTEQDGSAVRDSEKDRLPDDVQRLLDMARGAPAEYTVDILLRLAESAKIPDDEQKKELLEEAFELATRVQHPFRMWQVGSHTDTRAGKLSQAGRAGLDTLSIQARIVTEMMPIDRELARDLFLRMSRPEIGVISCEDTVIPNVSAFYEALTLVINKGFSEEEIQEEEHVQLALTHLTGISSSLQLVPAAQLVASQISSFDHMKTGGVDVAHDAQELLVAAYAERLTSLVESDREFDKVGRRRLPGAVFEIVQQVQTTGIDTNQLTASLRGYVVRHLVRNRCADTVARDERMIEALNETLAKLAVLTASEIEPITTEAGETETDREIVGRPIFSEYWKTPSAEKMLRAAQHLRFGEGDRYVPEDKRCEPEWQLEAADYLNQLAGWESAYGESEINFFHKKSALFEGFLDLAPKGDSKQSALQGYLEFLSRSPIQTSHPVEYRWDLNNLLSLARPFTEEGRRRLEQAQKKGQIPGLPGDYGSEILSAMRSSKNLVIALYGYAEDVIPIKRE